MVQNFSDCTGFQDGGDDFQGSTAMRAALDVDIEHSLEQTRPTDAHGSRGRRHIAIPTGYMTFVFLAARNDPGTKLRVRREYAIETNKVEPGADF